MNDTDPGTFRDPALPLADRVPDLISRLTVDEMIGLLHQHQAAVPRLGVGSFRTGTEALHGVAWLGEATVFPQAVGLGATWDPALVERVGAATGTEVRALHHKDPDRVGLNVWAPVVNPLRDPRWGRNEEGYAEDPWLTGVLGTAYAAGLRGGHPQHLRTAPTLKHFLGYNNETDRARTSSDLPPRVLHEYELPAFRAPIEAGAAVAVMASYNLVNGRPAHVSPLLGELRTWTSDELMVVGDAFAGNNIAGDQAFLPDHESGFGAALRAGVDCFTEDGASTVARLTAALDRGLISTDDVAGAARRILSVRFRLGEFDPAGSGPYAGIDVDVVNCAAHKLLALQAARRSVVLLRNENGLLPLAEPGRVAVIGPLAGTVLTDWYSGTLPYAVSLKDALDERLGGVTFAEGVDRVRLSTPAGPVSIDGSAVLDVLDWGGGVTTLRAGDRYVRAREDGVLAADRPGPGEWVVRETFEVAYRGDEVALRNVALDRWVTAGFDGTLRADATSAADATFFAATLVGDGPAAAAAAASEADVAVVVLGNHPMVNGRETEDRCDLALPPAQEAVLRAVWAANPRTVLVVTSSYPYAIDWAEANVPAILWTAHGGQEAGAALADLLLGDAEPTARLPQTWYRGAEDLPDLLDYDVIGSEATYLYFRGRPLYPFGHGLGYGRFEHRGLRLSADTVDSGGSVQISVDVVNTGDRAGEDVVQLYTRQRRSAVRQPLRRLRDFRRVRLEPGARETVTFTLTAADLAFHDTGRDGPLVETARHTVMIGRSCTDITASALLSVLGDTVGTRSGPLAAASRDEEYGTRLTAATALSGDAVMACSPDAWLRFARVDLGSGPRRVRVTAAAPAGGARLALRLGDPWTGHVAATLDVPPAAGVYDATSVSSPLTGPGGVHDLFLVLDTPGVRVSDIDWETA